MKKNIFIGIVVFALTLAGCETMLDVKSDNLLYPGQNNLDSPNDTIYSMVTIFSQLEKLADRYVLLGELRGDLMATSQYANSDLIEINNYEISKNNPYNKIEDYYSVINNCNYIINNLDTALVIKSEKIMFKNLAAAKAFRAWTYLQLALNYETVKYYETPILDVSDAKNFEVLTLQELLPRLIKDIEPWKDIETPGSISLGEDLNSSEPLYFPIRFLLGDLYLWKGEYENAAKEYYNLMVKNKYSVSPDIRSTWTVENGVFIKRETDKTFWPYLFNSAKEEITYIASSTEFGKGAPLYDMTKLNEIIPSTTAIKNWDDQIYYYNASKFIEGDLRGDNGSYISPLTPLLFGDLTYNIFSTKENTILKYFMMTAETAKAISVYRVGLLYLRYAEAVNRAGKPNLAFAVLKNGLNSQTLAVDTIVPKKEKYVQITDTTGVLIDYVNFEDLAFDNNIGIHARGCGNVFISKEYKIEEKSSLDDSIAWVEDKIIEELALETAFEGNRFHDLMRIALRRDNPAYLSDKVAEKYTNNKEAIRNKLLDKNNWYLRY